MESSEPVLSSVTGTTAHLVINRLERKNALNVAAYEALIAGLKAADADANIRCCVISGAGGNFTSGNDLMDFARNPAGAKVAIDFLAAISHFQKPVVAAVQGHAVGIGTTMLLHCDFAVLSETARLRMPFVNLGLTPEGGSSFLLPRLAGAKLASRLLMLGEEFSAATAERAGLATSVVAEGAVLDEAMAIAGRLAALPPEGLRLTKELLRREIASDLDAVIEHEARVFSQRLTSPEAQAAFLAFFAAKKS